jgi:phenylacetate-coenzyme A ligase PaaK-like adenylate-forming protein
MQRDDGRMVASRNVAHLRVINEDERGIGELVVSTLSNDYMPLLNYRIGDLVERQAAANEPGDQTTYVLHGRAPDTLKSPDGRRITTRDVDQCWIGCEGVLHYRLHETAAGTFRLSYIPEGDQAPTKAISETVEKLQQLIRPARAIEAVPVRYLLPEGSGKFVFNYPFSA